MRVSLPFEWMVALRFLREGRMQTFLILAGVTGGVAVIVFLTQLITQLQASIVDRVLGSQAHVVIRPLEEANSRAARNQKTLESLQSYIHSRLANVGEEQEHVMSALAGSRTNCCASWATASEWRCSASRSRQRVTAWPSRNT